MPQFNPPPSHFGWAVDTPNDYERLSFLFNHQPSVGMQLEEAVDILSHFQNNEHE
jgi:hypothetical protein